MSDKQETKYPFGMITQERDDVQEDLTLEHEYRLMILEDAIQLLDRLACNTPNYDNKEIRNCNRIPRGQYSCESNESLKNVFNRSETVDNREQEETLENENDLIQDVLGKLVPLPALQKTAFPSLLQHILQMKSHQKLMTKEIDIMACEVKSTREHLSESKTHSHNLEKIVRKLYKENQMLKNKLTKRNRQNKCLVSGIKEYLAKAQVKEKEEEENKKALMMALHERRLHDESLSFNIDDDKSIITDTSSLSNTSSFVTDEGRSTVRLAEYCTRDTKMVRKPMSYLRSKFTSESETKSIYQITFPSRDKVGLQLKSFPVNRKGRVYFRGSLSHVIDDDFDGWEDDISTFSRNSLENKGKMAFLVCGLYGYTKGKNQRPTLGARLVAIDNVSLESGHWAFEDLQELFWTKSGPLLLSFRNDTLNGQQSENFHKATIEAKIQAGLGKQEFCIDGKPLLTLHQIDITEGRARENKVAQKDEMPLLRDFTIECPGQGKSVPMLRDFSS